MKKLIAVATMALSFGAFATEVNFGYSGLESWGEVYYSCDSVEYHTQNVLELFGATDIDVRCSGGIESGWSGPVSISASFEVPTISRTATEVVKFRGDSFNPNCGLNVAIVRNLVKSFPAVTILKKDESCAWADSNFSYEFSIYR